MNPALALVLLVATAPRDVPVMEVTTDVRLDPTRTYGRIVIKASGITLDGAGARILGAVGGDPKTFRGIGIEARGVSGVTLKNVSVRGWETGLLVVDGEGWTVEGCDFSDNFHDPEFGWGENGRRGGIVLDRVRHSKILKNKANHVWDGCALVDSDENRLDGNDFSHTSNTGMKLWKSSKNTVIGNNLSYGLRIRPGEVHARDSACLLIETGSDNNRFEKNDCTHGGDGVFVRVLNGWVSVGNVFDGNDASFANNNAFEAWSPRNVYRHNKANHSSYGFWLGASDGTVLIANEASHNGEASGFHNSPHLPGNGHAGIVFMFGPSSHTLVKGNTCQGNNGAGIALIGDQGSQGEKWKAFHGIIEDNTLTGNRWGIYARFADWIDVSGNQFADNSEAAFSRDDSVTNVFEHDGPAVASPTAELTAPSRVRTGEPATLDATRSRTSSGHPPKVRWDLGDGTILAGSAPLLVRHEFREPGLKRVGLTIRDGRASSLAWRDVYVVEDRPEIATDGPSTDWTWDDPRSSVVFSEDPAQALAGRSAIRGEVKAYGGGRTTFVASVGSPARSLTGKKSLAFWVRSRNPNLPGWQGPNPVVTLRGPNRASRILTPARDWLAQPTENEAREGWTLVTVPLEGGDGWDVKGPRPTSLEAIGIGLDSWGMDPWTVWIDGMILKD